MQLIVLGSLKAVQGRSLGTLFSKSLNFDHLEPGPSQLILTARVGERIMPNDVGLISMIQSLGPVPYALIVDKAIDLDWLPDDWQPRLTLQKQDMDQDLLLAILPFFDLSDDQIKAWQKELKSASLHYDIAQKMMDTDQNSDDEDVVIQLIKKLKT